MAYNIKTGKHERNSAWHRGIGQGEYEYLNAEGYVAAIIYPNTQGRYVWSLEADEEANDSNCGIEDRLRDAKAAALKALGLGVPEVYVDGELIEGFGTASAPASGEDVPEALLRALGR